MTRASWEGTVREPSPSWYAAEKARELPRALSAGAEAMFENRLRWNPPHPGEDITPKIEGSGAFQSPYHRRARQATLYDFFDRATRTAVAAVIAEPIVIHDTMPPELADAAENIDLRGNDLTEYSRHWLLGAMDYGLGYTLIDHQPVLEGQSKADTTARPYWSHYLAGDLLNPGDYDLDTGVPRLRTVKLLETMPDGSERVRRLVAPVVSGMEFVLWEVYLPNEKDEWPEEGNPNFTGFMKPQTEIPLVTLYTGYRAPFEADPPFAGLADMNRLHYAKRSDLDAFIAKLTVAILHRSGVSADELKKGLEFVSGAVFGSIEPNAKMEFVEHTGRAYNAAAADLDRLEARMEQASLQPHVARSSNPTATGRAIDFQSARTEIAAWAAGLTDAIEMAFIYHARYLGVTMDEQAGGVTVNHQARIEPLDPAGVKPLVEVMKSVGYDGEEIVEELKRRRFLSPDLEPPKSATVLESNVSEGQFGRQPGAAAGGQPGR